MLAVYVVAASSKADFVKGIHVLLRNHKCQPVSLWAELSMPPLKDAYRAALRASWEMRSQQLDSADAVLVLAQEGEEFLEVSRALCLGKAVLWVGPHRSPACFAPGVYMADKVEDAMLHLAQAANAGGRPYGRDALLALASMQHDAEVRKFSPPLLVGGVTH